METLLIKDADAVITPTLAIPNCSVLIEGNIIKEVGAQMNSRADKIIDARGKVIIPGLINTHHHMFQTFQRNIPRVQNTGLFDWLTTLYEIWREITPEVIYTSTLLAVSELLLTGCTTTTDHHYLFPKNMPGTLIDEQIKAAKIAGIRFHPCRGSMSLGKSKGGLPPDDVIQDEETILKDSRRLIEKYHDQSQHSMLRIALAPCSPFSVSKSLMEKTVKLAREYDGVHCHTHLAETLDEEEYCLKEFGLTPFGLMQKFGWTGKDIWYAHAIYLSEKELIEMGRTQTGVAHCPTSNLRLGSGICPVPQMRLKNVPVGLAVDGSASNDSSNMLLEVRMAMLVHRSPGAVSGDWARSNINNNLSKKCPMTAQDALELATIGGAKVLGRDDIGEIAPGKSADIVIIDLMQIGYAGAQHDPGAAIVFCGDSQIVDTTIVNGKVVVKNGKITNVNTKELIVEANRLSKKMLNKAHKRTGINFMEPMWGSK